MKIYLLGGQVIELTNATPELFESQIKKLFENPESHEFVAFFDHVIRICHISGFE